MYIDSAESNSTVETWDIWLPPGERSVALLLRY
jgi:hypothetical protein